MVKETEKLIYQKVRGFYYNKKIKGGYLDFDRDKLYFDLTHPYASFFVLKELNLPISFGKRELHISGYKVTKIKTIEKDRVLYIVLKKKDAFWVVSLELLGKSSFFLILDERGVIRFKYPPHRTRNKGGDVGEEYSPPKRYKNFDIRKYFPHLDNFNEDDLMKKFMSSDVFYTDGVNVLPFQIKDYRMCGKYADCMFSIYKKLRFGYDEIEKQNVQIPYYIYYKGASMLENRMLKVVNNVLKIDGYTIPIKHNMTREEVIEYLYSEGKRLKRLWLNREEENFKDRENGPLKLLSPSGFEVLIGKSAKDNNRITFNIAKGDDTFFHVREYRGAHVILRNHGMPITEEDILFCAKLAKYYSKGKGGPVDVVYTPVKYVRPVPGIPGKVILTREKIIRV